ncbi:uncharacterized protein BDZ99DRAFT_254643 [Mytilinidion resinicola]|uniref:Uncharacterized protein n=1 Tax=Mytilinidion resinicola TaxID=574789 RepID=A0A6A6YZI0_9PEZI|nr:uncharacterized protein BDZ99DRAFT_254643 [Mytilinidion resinicola]KAF2813367.1 hypothetical protein BDZ99DRAFT_254643 [Mytilinidion resinicola]
MYVSGFQRVGELRVSEGTEVLATYHNDYNSNTYRDAKEAPNIQAVAHDTQKVVYVALVGGLTRGSKLLGLCKPEIITPTSGAVSLKLINIFQQIQSASRPQPPTNRKARQPAKPWLERAHAYRFRGRSRFPWDDGGRMLRGIITLHSDGGR